MSTFQWKKVKIKQAEVQFAENKHILTLWDLSFIYCEVNIQNKHPFIKHKKPNYQLSWWYLDGQ